MAFFYPRCPKCGGRSEGVMSDLDKGLFKGKVFIHNNQLARDLAKRFPPAALGFAAFSAGRSVFKVVAGEKQCKKCLHRF